MNEHPVEKNVPFAHDEEGNLIAVVCHACGTVVAVGYEHECVLPTGKEDV